MRSPLLLAVLLGSLAMAGATPRKGQEFPDFTAKDALTGQEFSLRDLRGKVVLIDFWATWCGPCVRELPGVKRIYSRFKDQGLEIVSISLDSDRNRFESFVRQKGMTWRHVMEGGGWGTRLAQQYGVNSIPLMIVVDAKGVVVADGLRGRRLEEVIESRLKGAKRPSGGDAQGKPAPSAASEALRQDLAALREQLADIADPLKELADELLDIDKQVAGLQPGAAASGAPAAQQVAALSGRLRGVRQELFRLGLIDEHNQVAIPIDPPEAADETSAASRLAPVLDSMGRSVRSMQELVVGAVVRRAALEAQVAELEKEAFARSSVAPAIESRAEKLRTDTDALTEPFGDSWVDRVETVERLISAADKALVAAAASMAELEPGLRSLARIADTGPRDAGRQALLESFSVARKKLEAAAALAGSGDAVALPTDPFEGRALKDTRDLTELKAQIRVATEAAAALRGLVADRRRSVKALAAEYEALRRQVAERIQSGASMEELEERFSVLSLQVLALGDPG